MNEEVLRASQDLHESGIEELINEALKSQGPDYTVYLAFFIGLLSLLGLLVTLHRQSKTAKDFVTRREFETMEKDMKKLVSKDDHSLMCDARTGPVRKRVDEIKETQDKQIEALMIVRESVSAIHANVKMLLIKDGIKPRDPKA
jgi:hypothetical protein